MVKRNIANKAFRIFFEAIPIILMILLIPIIKNDYILTGIYVVIIALSLIFRHEKNDVRILAFGFIIMTLAELFFIWTGVEIFLRRSYFTVMPLWLPFLWAYAFVAIKRAVRIIG